MVATVVREGAVRVVAEAAGLAVAVGKVVARAVAAAQMEALRVVAVDSAVAAVGGLAERVEVAMVAATAVAMVAVAMAVAMVVVMVAVMVVVETAVVAMEAAVTSSSLSTLSCRAVLSGRSVELGADHDRSVPGILARRLHCIRDAAVVEMVVAGAAAGAVVVTVQPCKPVRRTSRQRDAHASGVLRRFENAECAHRISSETVAREHTEKSSGNLKLALPAGPWCGGRDGVVALAMATLDYSTLDQLRSDCLADDIDIDLQEMQHWSEEEATRYFESGGVVKPPARRLRDVASLLAETELEHLTSALGSESLADWVTRLRLSSGGSRQELLRRLKVCGVPSLTERQAVVNALTRAWRDGRVAPPEPPSPPPPPPVQLWKAALSAMHELRQASAEELARRLPSGADLLSPRFAEMLADRCKYPSAAAVVRALPADVVAETLEALGWPLHHVRLLTESCGLRSGKPQPRLGHALAFWTNQLGERGTEIALYDYADYAERMLGLTSWVFHPPPGQGGARTKFGRRFGERVVAANFDAVGAFLVERGIGHLYILKEGMRFCPDVRMLPSSVRALVHCVFHATEPHGDLYAKISPCVNGSVPVVPHMVRPHDADGPDLRCELGIPPTATVFGRHGGLETFSIGSARLAVLDVACSHPQIYFVFLNTYPFGEMLPNIKYLERTSDPERVAAFIRTCDAMLHARDGGETFGLACAEFSASHRPVLTSQVHDDNGFGSHHLDVLRRAGLQRFFYRDYESLVKLLVGFQRGTSAQFHAYTDFEPHKVMATFERVFLGASPPLPAAGVDDVDGVDGGGGGGGGGGVDGVDGGGGGGVGGGGGHEEQPGSGDFGGAGDGSAAAVREAFDAPKGAAALEMPALDAKHPAESRWVDACVSGRLYMTRVQHGIELPGENAIFLASLRLPDGPSSQGRLVHVFRADALATFQESTIQLATSEGPYAQCEPSLARGARLTHGEDPRIFTFQGRAFVVDNTLNECRLIRLCERGATVDRVYRVALSGKNLTFLPPCTSGGDEAAPASDELLLVHWFRPLRVYRVTLPAGRGNDEFVGLQRIFASPGAFRDDDELRGGTPGRPAGNGTWWGLLHRTHHARGTLIHDPWAWVVYRTAGNGFGVKFSEVAVCDRDKHSRILDPCSIVAAEGASDSLLVTTAESEKGWFEPQAFLTCSYSLAVRGIDPPLSLPCAEHASKECSRRLHT